MDGRNYAVKKGNLSIVKFLYENGVDINEEHNDTSPLMLAAQAGWVQNQDHASVILMAPNLIALARSNSLSQIFLYQIMLMLIYMICLDIHHL